jgi:hypothetical protein
LGDDSSGRCEKEFVRAGVKFRVVAEIELLESTNTKALRIIMRTEKLS